MSNAKKYSLWLIPTGEVYDKLNTLISHLSRKYNAPYFKPHVTLIGEVDGSKDEIVSKAEQLAAVIQPFKIELGKIESLNEYFRCVFYRIKETNEIVRANQEAKKIFSQEIESKYIPHLSLIYGDYSPEIKKQIIAEIGKESNLSFDVNKIYLFSTSGKSQDLHKVKEFPLK